MARHKKKENPHSINLHLAIQRGLADQTRKNP